MPENIDRVADAAGCQKAEASALQLSPEEQMMAEAHEDLEKLYGPFAESIFHIRGPYTGTPLSVRTEANGEVCAYDDPMYAARVNTGPSPREVTCKREEEA